MVKTISSLLVKVLIVAVLFASLLGCQVLSKADQAVAITQKAIYVDELVRSNAIVDSLFSSSLSKEEISVIQQSLKAYNDFTEKWGGAITKNPLEAMTQTSLVISEYGVLRIRYAEIKRIVAANWDGYTPENQFLLTEYEKQAETLDSMIMNLLSNSKTNTALMAIQRLGIVAGQIALKII